ncbi:hypothetical protein K435DRAFT_843261 [Dendrothele bispora CBS 962.96]|uniref:Mug135-like C-terminal domain-containing protein n=1 Tax=Dendrothele bispora (strain CBS 962.96) TaxID=1314807 RepID=A0A4V4HD22_DENBC|nr:hypothetical protein K435DRAFT_843261 [Dendrothele bispora CBS 962.96]
MPVAVPENQLGLTLPAPSDPPSSLDIVNATQNVKHVTAIYEAPINRLPATADDVAAAEVYAHTLIASRSAAALYSTDAFKDTLREVFSEVVDNKLAQLTGVVDRLSRQIATIERNNAIAFNATAGHGFRNPWMVVTFPDNSDPTTAPHNLPRLSNINSIRSLSAEHLSIYFDTYPVPIPADISQLNNTDKKIVIAYYIGCRVGL